MPASVTEKGGNKGRGRQEVRGEREKEEGEKRVGERREERLSHLLSPTGLSSTTFSMGTCNDATSKQLRV